VIVVALFLVACLAQIIAFAVDFRTNGISGIPTLAALVSFLNLAALFWFYRVITTADVTLLGFGLPASASMLVVMWFATGMISVVVFGLALVKRYWRPLPALVMISSLVLQAIVIVFN
jgi:hypothetical protein